MRAKCCNASYHNINIKNSMQVVGFYLFLEPDSFIWFSHDRVLNRSWYIATN
jgi:hypothetical protein